MFGLFGSKVKDDADSIMALINRVEQQFLLPAKETVISSIESSGGGKISTDSITLNTPKIELAKIMLVGLENNEKLTARIVGIGRLAGFAIQKEPDLSWFTSVEGGVSYSATKDAKKLAQYLQDNFEIDNIQLMMNGGY